MTVQPLGPPPSGLASASLETTWTNPDRLWRISSYDTGEPYFGTSGANRFDAPRDVGKPSPFGTCYFGFSLAVAIAESILHDQTPTAGKFAVAIDYLETLFLIQCDGQPLKLATMAGAPLKRAGGHADLAGTVDIATTQRWALAIWQNPGDYDGFIYMSRHLNTEKAAVLFDRAGYKLRHVSAAPLIDTANFAAAAAMLGIVGI